MATIERKPLPPPNSTATAITEADRAEIVARANDVIDYYLNGPGSYFDSGTRKPLVSEFGENSADDLKNFKSNVIASLQFADDPNSIMRSVVGLIDEAIYQVEQASLNNEGRDNISLSPPNTGDPIDDPRVISPRSLDNVAAPISLPMEGAQPGTPLGRGALGISRPIRMLGRRIVDQSPASAFDRSPSTFPDQPVSFGGRFGNWISSPAVLTPNNSAQSVSPLPNGTPGIVSNAPVRYLSGASSHAPPVAMFDSSAPPARFVLPDSAKPSGGLAGWIAALAGIDPQNPEQPATSPPNDTPSGFYGGDPTQSWLTQALMRQSR